MEKPVKATGYASWVEFYGANRLAYPNQFFPWEFKQVSSGYWMGEDGRERALKTVKYVMDEIERISASCPFTAFLTSQVIDLSDDRPFQLRVRKNAKSDSDSGLSA